MAADLPGQDVVFAVNADVPTDVRVHVVGSNKVLGGWCPDGGFVLKISEKSFPIHSGTARIPGNERVEYKFAKILPDGVEWEQGPNRVLVVNSTGSAHGGMAVPHFGDRAPGFVPPPRLPGPLVLPAPPLPLAAAQQVSRASPERQRPETLSTMEVIFEVTCDSTEPGDTVRIVGSADALGKWLPSGGLTLGTTNGTYPKWSASTRLPVGVPMEWKTVICKSSGNTDWEGGENRGILLHSDAEGGAWRISVLWNDPGCRKELEKRGAANAFSPKSKVIVVHSPRRQERTSSTASTEPGETRDQCQDITRRSNSLSTMPASVPVATGGYDVRRQSSGFSSFLMPGQRLKLKLVDLPAAVVPHIGVTAVFENLFGGAKYTLQFDAADESEVAWKLNTAEMNLPPGVHLFHFDVEGQRVLSCQHPVYWGSNAILFNEALRRYILVRECAVAQTASSRTPSRSPERNEDVEKEAVKSSVVRPWSCAAGLAAMTKNPSNSKANIPSFDRGVFAGLYCPELRLRLDGMALPEPESSASSQTAAHSIALRLWSGAHLLKKQHGACEDAYFTSERALGVADGVGCMVQFASYGVNAAAYAAELMRHSSGYLSSRPQGEVVEPQDLAAQAMTVAEDAAEAYGASTVTVLSLQGRHVGVANLGDSGFMLLRKSQRGMAIVATSPEQQHSWNCPYQLTRLPQKLISRFKNISLDKSSDAEKMQVEVRPGDLLLLFTDGMRDNLHESEVLHIVDCALSPAFATLAGMSEHATPPENIARSLAIAAQERSLDPTAKVPFVEYSKRHGYQCVGGKQDDITVVAAWVVEDHGDRKRCAPALSEHLVARVAESAAKAAAEAEARAAAAAAESGDAKASCVDKADGGDSSASSLCPPARRTLSLNQKAPLLTAIPEVATPTADMAALTPHFNNEALGASVATAPAATAAIAREPAAIAEAPAAEGSGDISEALRFQRQLDAVLEVAAPRAAALAAEASCGFSSGSDAASPRPGRPEENGAVSVVSAAIRPEDVEPYANAALARAMGLQVPASGTIPNVADLAALADLEAAPCTNGVHAADGSPTTAETRETPHSRGKRGGKGGSNSRPKR